MCEVNDFINGIEQVCFDKSVESVGERNHAYAYGCFNSIMANTLHNLNLTKKQKKILEQQLNYWSK
jgi:hypothetical protein